MGAHRHLESAVQDIDQGNLRLSPFPMMSERRVEERSMSRDALCTYSLCVLSTDYKAACTLMLKPLLAGHLDTMVTIDRVKGVSA